MSVDTLGKYKFSVGGGFIYPLPSSNKCIIVWQCLFMSRVKLKKRYYYLFENIYPGRAMSFSLLPLIGFNILHLYSSPMMTSEPTTIPKLELTKYSHSIKINNYGKKLKIIFIISLLSLSCFSMITLFLEYTVAWNRYLLSDIHISFSSVSYRWY